MPYHQPKLSRNPASNTHANAIPARTSIARTAPLLVALLWASGCGEAASEEPITEDLGVVQSALCGSADATVAFQTCGLQ